MDWSRFAAQNQQAYNSQPQQTQPPPSPSPQGTPPFPGMGQGPQMPFGGGGGSQGPFGGLIPQRNPMSYGMNSLLIPLLMQMMGRQNQPGQMQAAPPGMNALGLGPKNAYGEYSMPGSVFSSQSQPGGINPSAGIPPLPNLNMLANAAQTQAQGTGAGQQFANAGISPGSPIVNALTGGAPPYSSSPFGLPQSNPMASQMNPLLMQALFAGGLGGGPFGGMSGGLPSGYTGGKAGVGGGSYDPYQTPPILGMNINSGRSQGDLAGSAMGMGGPPMVNQGGYPSQSLPGGNMPNQLPYPPSQSLPGGNMPNQLPYPFGGSGYYNWGNPNAGQLS